MTKNIYFRDNVMFILKTITMLSVACRGGRGERGAGPGHPRLGGIQRLKLQTLKCCT